MVERMIKYLPNKHAMCGSEELEFMKSLGNRFAHSPSYTGLFHEVKDRDSLVCSTVL